MNDFGKEVRELWTQAEEADKDNRKEALKDLEFAAPDDTAGHWDPQVRRYREQVGMERYGFPLPCLTINTVPQFVGQVIGDRRANQTSIKVMPREDGDVNVAEVRSELIRSIELQSRADRVRAIAFEQQVTCGIGHTRIDLEYARDDAFDRDLFIHSIPNPMAVLWDPLASDPTGRDAGYCFVSDRIARAEFKRRFPDATDTEMNADGLQGEGWTEGDTVRVAEYWRMDERKVTIAMMQDGSIKDVTGKKMDASMPVLMKPDGSPMIRDSKCKYAVMVMTNGLEELSDPFELKIPRVPIIRWMGRETWIGERRVRFGLVRYMRDPARLKDYNRSVRAELLMLMPRANFIAEARAVEGREGDWPNTLVHNDGSAPPVPIAAQLAAALLEEAQMFSQDMKETTGIYEAELGMKSNETSGIAIQRRQQQGDVASIIYHDNANSAMQEEGEVLNALVDIVYDTARTIRTVGLDDATKMVRINDPAHPQSIDLSVGKYDVTISTGPAYATRRQEQADQLMQLATRSPKFADVVPDYIVKSLDIEHADKMAERFKRTIPPQILGDEGDDDLSDEEKQQKQQAVQQAQAEEQTMKQLQFEGAQADVALKKAQAQKAGAEAMKAQAEAMVAGQGEGGPDPVAMDKNLIAAFDAQTRRLSALGKNDFPLPPEANAVLAARITEAILQTLGMEGELPPHVAVGITSSSLNEVAEQKSIEQEQRDQAAEQKQAGEAE